MRREHFGCLLVAGLVAFFVSAQTGNAGASPDGGDYADASVGLDASDLRFKVNGAGSKIKPGASLQGGFECAKRTVFVRAKIPVTDNAFLFKGPVESATGKPKGTLRWNGEWTAADRVSGTLRLKKGGCSSGSTEWEAALPPEVPTGLTATPASDSEIALDWTAAAHAEEYAIGRATNPGGPYTDISTTGDTQHEDSGLSEETTYYYVVRSINPAGDSASSEEASATTFETCTDDGSDDLPAGATNLGTVSGDTGSGSVNANDSICAGDTDWYRVNVSEGSNSDVDLTARADLAMSPALPAGNLDLTRRCLVAAGVSATSTNPGTSTETIFSGRDDGIMGDQSFVLFFEIDGSTSGDENSYSLTITGNVATADRSCNDP